MLKLNAKNKLEGRQLDQKKEAHQALKNQFKKITIWTQFLEQSEIKIYNL